MPGSGSAPRRQNLHEFCADFDALHLVGGGYLTDTFPEVLIHAWCFAQTFGDQGKPVVLTGQQVGPFQSHVLERLAARLLRSARFVGLREPSHSVELCRRFRVNQQRFAVMGDDSFGLPSASEAEVASCLAAHQLEAEKFLALNVRVGPYAAGHGEYLRLIAQIGETLALDFGLPILIVPIAFNDCDSDDRSGQALLEMMPRVQKQRIDSGQLTPALVRGVLGRAFGAVGVSYHLCTFALGQGVPAVCLHEGDYYSQKARGVCQFWGDDRLAVSLRDADANSAVRQISSVLRDSALRARLARQGPAATTRWHEIFDTQIQKCFKGGFSPQASVSQGRAKLAAGATDWPL